MSINKRELIDLVKEIPIKEGLYVLSQIDSKLYKGHREDFHIQRQLLETFFNDKDLEYFLRGISRKKFSVVSI